MSSELLAKLKPIPQAGEMVLDSPATSAAIIEIRKALKISQKALALEMGFTQAYLCDLEQGYRQWNLSLFNRAKQALTRLVK